MKNFVNDFYTVTADPVDFFALAPLRTNVDVDISGFNSIIIINVTNRTVQIPFPGGKNVFKYGKLEIKGKDLENYAGKITISFLKSLTDPVGQCLFIRKKFI
jgi:hypothetical protein